MFWLGSEALLVQISGILRFLKDYLVNLSCKLQTDLLQIERGCWGGGSKVIFLRFYFADVNEQA